MGQNHTEQEKVRVGVTVRFLINGSDLWGFAGRKIPQ
jgi:hypothetical protein